MASRRNATGISVRLVAETEQAARRLWVAQANSDTAILFMHRPTRIRGEPTKEPCP
jgi:hypothetical protein